MTEDTPDVDHDDNLERLQSFSSRRAFLRTTAMVPVGYQAAATGSSDETTADSQPSLVEAAMLPEPFEPWETDRLPFARRLQNMDGRFSTEHVRGRAFTDRPESAKPRYSVGTVAVDLPTTAAVLPVRTAAVECFVDVMREYTGAVSKDWSVELASDRPQRQYRMHGVVEGDAKTLSSVAWITASSPRFAEQWALAATDKQAVLTVVYGYQQGPWEPRRLLAQISRYVRKRLAGRPTRSGIARHYDHTPTDQDSSIHE